MHASAFRPGGGLYWAVWDDLPGHVAMMLAAIYLTWAVYLLLAARRPADYASFLNFTMWANLVHGLVMAPGALEHEYHSKFLTDIPWILLLSVAIYLLRPRADTASAGAPREAVAR
jgi:drug/metabolite transporter (DMT)-like permease